MNNESGVTNNEIEIEPVEIHEEFYSTNLFGEPTGGERQGLKSDSQGLALKSRPEFNIFALTDAIGSRNKREAWVLYHKALASGMVPEEVFYKLVWQIKTMMLASKTRSPEEADMKSFPYNKAKGFLRNFKPGELEKISENLVRGYHEVRRGNEETETFVEKTLLGL